MLVVCFAELLPPHLIPQNPCETAVLPGFTFCGGPWLLPKIFKKESNAVLLPISKKSNKYQYQECTAISILIPKCKKIIKPTSYPVMILKYFLVLISILISRIYFIISSVVLVPENWCRRSLLRGLLKVSTD